MGPLFNPTTAAALLAVLSAVAIEHGYVFFLEIVGIGSDIVGACMVSM